MVKSGQHFGYVITVLRRSNAERCPIFPAWRSVSIGVFPTFGPVWRGPKKISRHPLY